MAAAQQILGSLALALLACGLLAVAAAGVVGRRVARAGVAPVRELTAEVEQRAAEDDLAPVRGGRGRRARPPRRRLQPPARHGQGVADAPGRFVADAGHELRTPLTSLRTNIELLTADADRAMLDPADRMTIMRDVRGAAGRVLDARLRPHRAHPGGPDVRRLRGGRPDGGARRGGRPGEHAGPRRAVGRGPGPGRTCRATPTCSPGPSANVLDNAVKYSPPGGTVSVTLEAARSGSATRAAGSSRRSGPSSSTGSSARRPSRATPGTGLGLSITESVVRQHGGTVAVTDAPGGGAQFVLTFPRDGRRRPAPGPTPAGALRDR